MKNLRYQKYKKNLFFSLALNIREVLIEIIFYSWNLLNLVYLIIFVTGEKTQKTHFFILIKKKIDFRRIDKNFIKNGIYNRYKYILSLPKVLIVKSIF